MKSVLEAVSEHAHERGHSIALTDGRASLTYEALWQKTEEWAETLAAKSSCCIDAPSPPPHSGRKSVGFPLSHC
jgi:Mg-chelatase subunit ChlD